MKETYKAIPGFEGIYEVSNYGEVKSLDRHVAHAGGLRFVKGRTLTKKLDKHGRYFVSLSEDGATKTYTIHRLVMLAFVGERPEGTEICHNDSDPTNNRLDNLRYATRSSNNIDRYITGSKQDEVKRVLEIRRLHATGEYSLAKLGEKFGMTKGSISRIIHRRRFGWLNDDGTVNESYNKVS